MWVQWVSVYEMGGKIMWLLLVKCVSKVFG